MVKTAAGRTGTLRNCLEECEFSLAMLNFTLSNFVLFLISLQALQEVIPGYLLNCILHGRFHSLDSLSVPSERDLTGFKSTLAPSKLIQPLEGEGRNAYSFLSTSLGVLTALKDLIPGKKNNQLIRMGTILIYYFICCKLTTEKID